LTPLGSAKSYDFTIISKKASRVIQCHPRKKQKKARQLAGLRF